MIFEEHVSEQNKSYYRLLHSIQTATCIHVCPIAHYYNIASEYKGISISKSCISIVTPYGDIALCHADT